MNNIDDFIDFVLKETNHLKNNFQINIMCNSRSNTRKINGQNIEYSDQNEFFSDQEFNEIYEAIQNEGFYTTVSFNELSLIKKILEESFYVNNKIIYNLSRNGSYIGKKSLMPAFLDHVNIPYTGSNAFVISLCREKYIYTKYLESHGVSVPKMFLYLGNRKWFDNQTPSINLKCITKPIQESASIGLDQNSVMQMTVSKLKEIEEKYINTCNPILFQEFIEGYECEVPLFIAKNSNVFTLDPIGISIDNNRNLESNILTYSHSFKNDYNFFLMKEELGNIKSEEIKKTAKKIAHLMRISQYGRVDFRIDKKGTPFLIDIAATPYTTKHSSFAYSYNELKLPYETIYSMIIGLAYLNSKSN